MAITISGSGITSANIADGTIVNADVADVAASKLTGALPAIDGSALTGLASANQAQVQTHLITTSSQLIYANTVTNITGLNATITPSTTSKRIKVTARWNGEWSGATNAHDSVFGLKRDTTIIGNPATSGSRRVGMSIVAMGYAAEEAGSTPDSSFYSYIDSPATTSATTYYATFITDEAGTLYNQRTVNNIDGAYAELLTSNITLEEID